MLIVFLAIHLAAAASGQIESRQQQPAIVVNSARCDPLALTATIYQSQADETGRKVEYQTTVCGPIIQFERETSAEAFSRQAKARK